MPDKEDPMKYMILIHQGTTPLPGTPEWDALSPEEQQQVYADYGAVNQTPGFTPGERMAGPETATTVRVDGGQTLTTDGPFVETKEVLGGFYLVDVPNLDDALEFASKVPAARLGGAVEVRPLVER
jgi:hypothetical protein